jgi:hypothetical protein
MQNNTQDTLITISKHIYCPDFDLVPGDVIQIIGFPDFIRCNSERWVPNKRFIRIKVISGELQGDMSDIDLTEVL